MYKGPERRKYVRIPFSFPVRFKEITYSEDGGEEHGVTKYAYSSDISEEGIQLKFIGEIDIGNLLHLHITLPFEENCIIVTAKGKVVWGRTDETDNVFYVGVQFVEIDAEDRNKLKEFVEFFVKDETEAEKAIKNYLTPEKISKYLKRPINVLVVDDETNIRNILDLRLTMKKIFNVEHADSGQKVFEKIKEKKPDIILLDIMLPDMDGFEICAKIKKQEETKDIPVIFLTAKNKTEDVIKAIRVGVDDYIVKPYEFDELFYQMIKVLDSTKGVKRIITD